MPYELPLPAAFRNARWRVKIREKENREPPHVTILRGTCAWRLNLRTGEFMDRNPDPDEVPAELVDFIRSESNWKRLEEEWNRKYPSNPVHEVEPDDEE